MLDTPASDSQNAQDFVSRRARVKLPSIWTHLFWSVATFFMLIIGAWIFIEAFGDTKSVVSDGAILVDPQLMPAESDTLAGSSNTLPDLLDGDVPRNINPTTLLNNRSRVDALGNPLPNTNRQNPDSPLLTGSQQKVTTPTRPITINGRPININASALPPAPIMGLSRQGPFGPVPAPNATGLTPYSAYKRPFSTPAGQQPVSIIIGGLGIRSDVTQQAISTLPPEVTLSFAAHAPNLQDWINQARQAGHEVLLEVPMESTEFDPTEPGAERALMADASKEQNLRNMDWMMSRAQGYFGVTNFNGDKFLTRTDSVAPVMSHLEKSGLSLVFDGSSSAPSLPLLASTARVPFAEAYTLLDLTPDPENIQIELSRLQAQASAGSGAIGFGFAYPQTISAVASWTRTLSNQQLVLAPASTSLP